MFGYIVTDRKTLSKAEITRYRTFYCGLCRQLGEKYGNTGRMTLTFDMTLVTMLLSSLYNLGETTGRQTCIRHPICSQPYVITEATDYAADLNIFLAYFQALDDYHDDRNTAAGKKSKQLEGFLAGIKGRYPRACDTIENSLRHLSEIEKRNEINPDIPANCFGQLLGEVFVWREDEHAETLRGMGAALGRFIYLLDACNDLKADIKKQRYNPLVTQINMDFTPVLTMLMGECTTYFEELSLKQDVHILRNILYSGVWMNYRIKGKVAVDG